MAVLCLSEENTQLLQHVSSGLSAPTDVRAILDTLKEVSSEDGARKCLLTALALLQLLKSLDTVADAQVGDIRKLARVIGNDFLSVLRVEKVETGNADNEKLALTAEAGLACLAFLVENLRCPLEDDTLIHATAYTNRTDSWTTDGAARLANALLAECRPGQLTEEYIVQWLLPKHLRPIFDKATSKVTQSGRPSHFPETAPRDFKALDQPAWKRNGLQVITVARWAVDNSSEELIRDHWPGFTPVLLTISEDNDTEIRTSGLEIVVNFLRKCQAKKLESTGIGKVFEDAILPSLLYLPSLTPEAESVKIMRPAYEALLVLAKKHADCRSPVRRALLDKILREGLFAAYEHASGYLEVVETLMNVATTLVDTLGIYSVKHLPSLFSMISSVLTDPFMASHPAVLFQATRTLEAIITNCWPRIVQGEYDSEAIRIIATCWLNVVDGMAGVPASRTGMDELKHELRQTHALLRAVGGPSPPPGVNQALMEEPKLRELFFAT